jgi:hypothetical protein
MMQLGVARLFITRVDPSPKVTANALSAGFHRMIQRRHYTGQDRAANGPLWAKVQSNRIEVVPGLVEVRWRSPA